MFSNLKAQSFHEVALESKFTNLENARDLMNALCRLGVPCSGSTSGLTSTSAASLFQRSKLVTHFLSSRRMKDWKKTEANPHDSTTEEKGDKARADEFTTEETGNKASRNDP